jgi:aerobic carbon-monoxide dehydrogenase medium subunit
MKPAPFTYHRPGTLGDALELLEQLAPEDGRIIAGGQSLLPMMALRLARPQHLIDINGVPALDTVLSSGDRLRIGATVRHATIERSAAAADRLTQFLAHIARHIAHPPIRNRGTVCGSIANSDPASEWCLTAVTLDAEIVVHSTRGTRTIAAGSFFLGPMTNVLAPDELIVEVRLPLLNRAMRCGFYEVARVSGGFAVAAAMVRYEVGQGRIIAARLGVAGVEAAPRRVPEAEVMLEGMDATQLELERVAEAAAHAVTPVEDARWSESARRQLVRAVTARALQQSLL